MNSKIHITDMKLNSSCINYKTKVHLQCFIYYRYYKKSFEDQNLKLKLDLFNSYRGNELKFLIACHNFDPRIGIQTTRLHEYQRE
ncbi:hypothetical protein CICLE_v10010055mg [Citrus x clementina]|uniref:Uncharacterized protein n=1 Tax=Citrus clementina TaxID=85681 RepID=V4UQS5_CITCL|nr:hypothetical protein CICLE_v10010055mg [Citrus x clementina]